MKDNNRVDAGYNCQTAVDEKNGLIIANDVSNESNDLHQLNNMIDRVRGLKEDLEEEVKTITAADAGYFEEKEIVKAATVENFDVYVSHPRDASKKKNSKVKEKIPAEGYTKDDFKYDKENDRFYCPEGKALERNGKGYIDKQSGTRKYQYICKECKGCANRALCTDNKKGRMVTEEVIIACFPLAAIKYGLGNLIHCGLNLKKDRYQDVELVTSALDACINKIRKEGIL